jgi:hypothetical protein
VPAEVKLQTEGPGTVRAGQRFRTCCICRALAAAIRRSPVRHQNDLITDPWQGDVEAIDEFLFSLQESSLLGDDRFKNFHEVFGHICLPSQWILLMTETVYLGGSKPHPNSLDTVLPNRKMVTKEDGDGQQTSETDATRQ